jgi:hypothetical protein
MGRCYFNLGQVRRGQEGLRAGALHRPYNSAARRWHGAVAQPPAATTTRPPTIQTRAELLSQVDAAWEMSVACRKLLPGVAPPACRLRQRWCDLHPAEAPQHRGSGHRLRGHLGRGGHRLPAHALDRTRHPRARPRQARASTSSSASRRIAGGGVPMTARHRTAAASALAPPAPSGFPNSACATCRWPRPCSTTSARPPACAGRSMTSP